MNIVLETYDYSQIFVTIPSIHKYISMNNIATLVITNSSCLLLFGSKRTEPDRNQILTTINLLLFEYFKNWLLMTSIIILCTFLACKEKQGCPFCNYGRPVAHTLNLLLHSTGHL